MTPVSAGSRVKYSGSLPEFHGTGTVLSADDFDHSLVKSDDGYRYIIRLDTGKFIYNVRRQSFAEYADETVLVEAEA